MSTLNDFLKFVLLTISITLGSCGGSSSEDNPTTPTPTTTPVIATPQNVLALSNNGNVTLTWEATSTSYQFDVYISTEAGLKFENYSTFENSEWIKNVTSPYTYSPTDYSKPFFFVIVAKQGINESAQSDIVSAAPRYIETGNEIVDLHTSLIWQLCAIGQTLNSTNNSCDGEPLRLSHQETLNKLPEYGEGWRIPSADELITLVFCSNNSPSYFLTSLEDKCDTTNLTSPTIYSQIFVNTLTSPTPYYRTNTRYMPEGGSTFVFYELINFASGGTSQIHGNEPSAIFVRLVKTKS